MKISRDYIIECKTREEIKGIKDLLSESKDLDWDWSLVEPYTKPYGYFYFYEDHWHLLPTILTTEAKIQAPHLLREPIDVDHLEDEEWPDTWLHLLKEPEENKGFYWDEFTENIRKNGLSKKSLKDEDKHTFGKDDQGRLTCEPSTSYEIELARAHTFYRRR